jgi:myosin heavy subunit
MTLLEERVDRLGEALHGFVTDVGIEFNKLYNAQMRTELELRAFKDEMKEFKDEMKEFKDEMKEFKDEMKEFKDEMKAYKEEGRQQNREMNRRWGELANKMGTLVEDLVAPSLPRIVPEVLGQEVTDLSVRFKRRLADGRVREFDGLTFTADVVCLNSTKSTLRSADVDRFSEEVEAFRTFFPEHAATPIVGILASLYVDPSVLTYAERQGLVVLGVGDEVMEVKNSAGFVPKRW